MVKTTHAVKQKHSNIWDDTNYSVAQWVTTRKDPIPQRLPAQYGVVTSNTSECINSMMEEYWGESWTDLLEGIICRMTQRIHDKRQEYNKERGDDVVLKVKAILGESFHKAAAMEVVKLV